MEKFPKTITELTGIRESLGLEKLSHIVSIDATERDKEIRQQLLADEQAPLTERLRVERVDLMNQLEPYSEEEIEIMLRNTKHFELTLGCDGGCPFCYATEKGEKRGVSATFTWKSLVEFEKKYRKYLHGFVFDYKSDPMAYEDVDEEGRHTFLNVYELYGADLTISTAIPPRTEEHFLEFCKGTINEVLEGSHWADMENGGYYGPLYGPQLRLSVGKHNIRRVEATMKTLAENLAAAGYSKKQMETYFRNAFKVETRLDPLMLGPMIDRLDPLKNPEAFPCQDGVIVSPGEIKAMLPISPSKFHSAGHITYLLQPGKVREQVPQAISHLNYVHAGKTPRKSSVIPLPRTTEGRLIELENPDETAVLYLGRAAHTLGTFVTAVANADTSEEGGKDMALQNLRRYMKSAKTGLREIEEAVKPLLEPVQYRIEGNTEKAEELYLYSLLYLVQKKEADFLMELYKHDAEMEEIIAVAQTFRSLSSETIDTLPDIIAKKREEYPISEGWKVGRKLKTRLAKIFRR